jgi:hypothetical protein
VRARACVQAIFKTDNTLFFELDEGIGRYMQNAHMGSTREVGTTFQFHYGYNFSVHCMVHCHCTLAIAIGFAFERTNRKWNVTMNVTLKCHILSALSMALREGFRLRFA